MYLCRDIGNYAIAILLPIQSMIVSTDLHKRWGFPVPTNVSLIFFFQIEIYCAIFYRLSTW